MFFIQILLIPFKLIFRFLGLLVYGLLKVLVFPFKFAAALLRLIGLALCVLSALCGIYFIAGGFLGLDGVPEHWLPVGAGMLVMAMLAYFIPIVGIALVSVVDSAADAIDDFFSDFPILPQ